MTVNVVSVRVGDKYGPEYVLNLHHGISRHLAEDQVHFCLTDDPDSLPEGVTAIPNNPDLPGWWQKVFLFSPDMPWAEGDEILYMDLDVCVTGRLEGLPDGIIKDWHWPCYNSSVMKWRHGEHSEVWGGFDKALIDTPSTRLAHLLPKSQVNGGDQEWITAISEWPTFDPDWFVSYRDATAWPPETCRAVIFHGRPNPHEVTDGWVPNVWRAGGYTAPPRLDGMNVTSDFVYDNIRQNIDRDVEWFLGNDKVPGSCVIVGGGPSMKDSLQAIKDHRRRGARIVTVNNALSYLHDRWITPDAHVMLDAREENVSMIENAPKSVRYFLASQVNPVVFDALKDHDVFMWHCGIHDGERLLEIIKPYWETKPVVFIPGGGTVGLRALNLAWLSGYKKIHLYGFDSSYEGDGHHAYPQPMNDGEQRLTVAMGDKTYVCAPWMLRQAKEFQDNYAALVKEGVSVRVHGRGLIPDLWRAMQN